MHGQLRDADNEELEERDAKTSEPDGVASCSRGLHEGGDGERKGYVSEVRLRREESDAGCNRRARASMAGGAQTLSNSNSFILRGGRMAKQPIRHA